MAEEQRLTEDEALAISTRYLEAHKAEYGLTDLAKDLSEPKVRTSRHMSAAVMYMQLYKGIPVVPGGIVVHIWKSSVEKVSDHLLKDIDLDSTGAITKEQALDIAIQKFESLCDSAEVYKTELLITNDPRDDRIRLTWSVVLRCLAKLEARGYNIDAFTGEIFAESDGKKR